MTEWKCNPTWKGRHSDRGLTAFLTFTYCCYCGWFGTPGGTGVRCTTAYKSIKTIWKGIAQQRQAALQHTGQHIYLMTRGFWIWFQLLVFPFGCHKLWFLPTVQKHKVYCRISTVPLLWVPHDGLINSSVKVEKPNMPVLKMYCCMINTYYGLWYKNVISTTFFMLR